jgi:hypothetical protein
MFTGVLVEQSLKNLSILSSLELLNSWTDGDWKLHKVRVSEDDIKLIQFNLTRGTWYTHFWGDDEDSIIVVYKDAVFHIKYRDKDTWIEAIKHGLELGIPAKQLDFRVNQDL